MRQVPYPSQVVQPQQSAGWSPLWHLSWASVLGAAVSFASWYYASHVQTVAAPPVPSGGAVSPQGGGQPADGGGTAPKKACGKCGSPDCGCQTDKQALDALKQALDALKDVRPPKKTDDPFDARNSTRPTDGRVADSTGRLWIVADADDADQRSWWSKDGGKTWWRDGKPNLVAIPATECRCPATGNKDGSRGPNNCRCHDMGLDCKCHKGAGIIYTAAPAGKVPAMPAPTQPPMGMMPPMAAVPMRMTSTGMTKACST